MARKPFFESMWENSSYPWIAAVIGAVSLYVYFARRRSIPRSRPGTSTSVGPVTGSIGGSVGQSDKDALWSLIKANKFSQSKVCVALEVLLHGDQWRMDAKEMFARLCRTSDVYLMCKIIAGSGQKKDILAMMSGFEGLVRHKILFCSTSKGYEAFGRQISPSLMVLHDHTLATFLSNVLPYVIHVENTSAANPQEKPSPTNKFVSVKTFADIPFCS